MDSKAFLFILQLSSRTLRLRRIKHLMGQPWLIHAKHNIFPEDAGCSTVFSR